MVERIISGGQTGADQAGLLAGHTLDLSTGGWCPKGWRTDSGPAPWLETLGVKCHTSPDYPPRTALNVRDSDGTLIVGYLGSPGCKLTLELADRYKRPVFDIHWPKMKYEREFLIEWFRRWIEERKIVTLNVAGNRESKNRGIGLWTYEFIVEALSE